MLNLAAVNHSNSNPTYFLLQKPWANHHGASFFVRSRAPLKQKQKRINYNVRCSGINYGASSSSQAAAVSAEADTKAVQVKVTATVQLTVGGLFSDLTLTRGLDDIKDLLGQTLLLELASAELDPKTGLEKETIKGYVHKKQQKENEVKYEAELEVPNGFGEIGAILVENEHRKEMFLKEVLLDGFITGPVRFSCNSWLHSKYDNPVKRVFFRNKSYLPSQTPEGVKRFREEELVILRGNGQGERQTFERVYDYDVYNDLGQPDSSADLKRPVLGGKKHPYPRRCRTGRPRSKTEYRQFKVVDPGYQSGGHLGRFFFSAC